MANNEDILKTEDMEPSSNITYATDVVAIIVGLAAAEVEGIASMVSISGGNILGRGKNSEITKGVKVEVGTEEVSCDLYVIVEYGRPIQKVAQDVQESVRRAVENMTGLAVVRVDVHVQGVSFEQENKNITAGAQKATLTAGEKKSKKAKVAEPAEPATPAKEESAEE